MEIREMPGRGLGVVATRPLQAGETIIKEIPIVLYPQSSAVSEVCNFCLRWLTAPGVGSPVACPSCSTARFCSQECATAASADPSSHCHLVCRCLSACNAAGLSDDDQSTLGYLFRSCSLLFASQAGDQSASSRLAQIEALASYPPETAAQFRSESHLLRAQELHGRILHALATVGMDSTPISPEFIANLLEKEAVNSYGIPAPLLPEADNEATRRLRGSGLYPLASRVNHECLPNATRFDDFDCTACTAGSNTTLSLRTLHALPAGEEVTQSYFPMTWTFVQRQERCREQYGFVCRCPRCKEEATWPPEEQGADTAAPEDLALVKEMVSTVTAQSMMEIQGGGGGGEDVADAGYIHVFLFKFVCPREGCGGTMAPVSEHQQQDLQCNVCGQTRTEAEFLAELEASS